MCFMCASLCAGGC
jgi:hypothetical protein